MTSDLVTAVDVSVYEVGADGMGEELMQPIEIWKVPVSEFTVVFFHNKTYLGLGSLRYYKHII